MNKLIRKVITIAVIAGMLVLCDGIITKIFNQDGSFAWIAFVGWTVFFCSNTKERLTTIPGHVIGFLVAVAIIRLGNWFSFIPLNIIGVAAGSILATMLINFTCIELESINRYFPISISGIFVGIAMTFSGLEVGMTANTISSSLIMLAIIVFYGILELLSGWITLKFGIKD